MPLTRLPLTTGVSGTLPIANGGTNVTTAADLANTGNMVKLSTATITNGDTEVVFDSSVITDTYKIYKVVYSGIHIGTDSASIRYRYSEDNGSTYKSGTSSYRYVMQGADVGDSNNTIHSRHSSATEGYLVGTLNNLGNDTRENCCGYIDFYNFRDSNSAVLSEGVTAYTDNVFTGAVMRHMTLYHDSGLTVNNIKFFTSTGDFDSGTFTLYGINL